MPNQDIRLSVVFTQTPREQILMYDCLTFWQSSIRLPTCNGFYFQDHSLVILQFVYHNKDTKGPWLETITNRHVCQSTLKVNFSCPYFYAIQRIHSYLLKKNPSKATCSFYGIIQEGLCLSSTRSLIPCSLGINSTCFHTGKQKPFLLSCYH